MQYPTNAAGSTPKPRRRVPLVDAVRGVAVLAMIEWHTADGWLVDDVRDGEGFRLARIVGGLAAPLFLLLAGASSALAMPERPTAMDTLHAMRRGLRVVVLGYALKLFSWAIDRGAIIELANVPTAIAHTLGIGLLLAAVSEKERRLVVRAALAAAGALSIQLGWLRIDVCTRAAATLLPRLDVLQGIGAALVATALVLFATQRLRAHARVALLGVLAALVALVAPYFWGVELPLPTRLADYVARTSSPETTGARFALFPWGAYALLGAAAGLTMRRERASRMRAGSLVAIAASALVVALLATEALPVGELIVTRYPTLVSALRLVFNTSVATLAGALSALGYRHLEVAGEGSLTGHALHALVTLGRHSLVVYFAHLELAYGLAGVPLRHLLDPLWWALAALALTAAMIALARAMPAIEQRYEAALSRLRARLFRAAPLGDRNDSARTP